MNVTVVIPASDGFLTLVLGGGIFATLDTSVVAQAPATLSVWVTSAIASSQISAEISGTVVASAQASSDGTAQVLVPVTPTLGGTVGSHNILIRQTIGSNNLETAVLTYSVTNAPALLPSTPTPDAPAAPVPAAVSPTGRKWVFQDPSAGGLGNYILPINPRNMTSPHHEHSFTSRHTTARSSGRYHIFQAAMLPKDWEFGGYCPTEEMAEKLWEFRELNHRIYIVDHHGRAWKVAITHLDIVPRLRHTFNNEISDWGSDWTMTVTVLDQNPVLV